jgi:gliding motility-associated-like protein
VVTLTLTADGNADCGQATDQMQITVEADVIANAGSDASICENSAYTVNDASVTNGNGTYSWGHDGNGILTNGTTLTPTYTADAADAGTVVTLTLTADGNADCGQATDQMQITVEADVIANAGSDASICENSAYTVNDASVTNGNGTYSWGHDGNGILTNGTTLTPTYTADAADAGTVVTLTLTADGNADCGQATDQMQITVEADVSADAGSNAIICETSSYTVNDASVTNGNGTYSWGHDGNGILTNGTTLTPTYTADAADAGTVVTLTLTADGNADCGQATDQMQITVEADVSADAGSDAAICETSAYTVNDASVTNGNGTYSWGYDGNGILTNGTTLTPTYTADAADAGTVVTLTLTADGNADCGQATDQMQITVDPLVSVYAGSDAAICETSAYTVNDASVTNGNGTYSWTHDGNGTITNGTTLTPTYTPDASDAGNIVTLTLTAGSSGTCPPGNDDMEITIHPKPATSVISGNSTPNCFASGEAYSVLLTSGSKYHWSVPASAVITSDTSVIENNSIEMDFGSISGNIRVYETDQFGCTGDEVALLIELQGCNLDADFTVSDDNICIEETVVFTNESGGTSETTVYSWNFGEGAVPAAASTIGPHDVYYSTAGSKTVTLTITQGLSDTEEKTDFVVVNPTPVATIDPAERCGAGEIIMDAYCTNGDIVDFSGDGGTSVDFTDYEAPYQYSLNINEGNSVETWVRSRNSVTQCVGDWLNSALSYSYTVPVTGEIIPENPSGDENFIDIVCAGTENAGYSVEETAGSTYNWSIPALGLTIENSTQINVNWDIAGGAYLIQVQEISEHGCAGIVREETVLVSDPQTEITGDTEICYGNSSAFNTTAEFSRYLWYNGSTAPGITVSEERYVSVVTWNEYDCASKDSVYLYVYELPTVDLGNDTVICGSNSVVVDAGDFAEYLWSTGQTGNPVILYEGEKTVSVTVTDDHGCSASDLIHVNACIPEELMEEITNAFTPNDDGVHDTWIINNIYLFPDAKIEVFDRWGRMVFSKDGGYENDWDGTYNGKDLPMDNYYYVIDLKTGAEPIHGTLTIIR